MFDFAWSHFALLFVIAVILLGPKELPTVLRFIGRWTGKIRQHKSEFQEYFDAITAETAEISKNSEPVTPVIDTQNNNENDKQSSKKKAS